VDAPAPVATYCVGVLLQMRHWGLEVFLLTYALANAVSVLVADKPHLLVVTVVSALQVGVLAGRRIHALGVTVLAFGLLVVGMAISPEATTVQFLGMVITFGVAGIINRGRALVLAMAAGAVPLVFGTLVLDTGAGLSDFLLSTAICEGFLVAAHLLGRRTRQVSSMQRDLAVAEERERARTRRALLEERARIARELHDVVSHGLSVIVVQAQAAGSALHDLDDPAVESVGRRLAAVESTARDALGEMRMMLGLLQLDAEEALAPPTQPSPGLADLETVFARARGAGLPLTTQLPTGSTHFSAGLELAIHRIVQEALTNVLKHAPGAPTVVLVSREGADVEVVVRNGASESPDDESAAGGHGLVGMRERVTLYGGSLDVGATADGSFEVRARLPCSEPVAVPEPAGEGRA
jgi:signal transduction histidine kinase